MSRLSFFFIFFASVFGWYVILNLFVFFAFDHWSFCCIKRRCQRGFLHLLLLVFGPSTTLKEGINKFLLLSVTFCYQRGHWLNTMSADFLLFFKLISCQKEVWFVSCPFGWCGLGLAPLDNGWGGDLFLGFLCGGCSVWHHWSMDCVVIDLDFIGVLAVDGFFEWKG